MGSPSFPARTTGLETAVGDSEVPSWTLGAKPNWKVEVANEEDGVG